jgi:hypothetical protein
MLIAALVLVAAVFPSGAFAMRYDEAPGSDAAGDYAVASQDLRSPDAQDAGRASELAAVQDLRSPDTRDVAAASLARTESIDVSPSQTAPSVATTPSVSDAFDWGDAGLGAAGMLALVALAGGIALLVVRGRQRPRTT